MSCTDGTSYEIHAGAGLDATGTVGIEGEGGRGYSGNLLTDDDNDEINDGVWYAPFGCYTSY